MLLFLLILTLKNDWTLSIRKVGFQIEEKRVSSVDVPKENFGSFLETGDDHGDGMDMPFNILTLFEMYVTNDICLE
jgi:hypothetical protein